MYKRETRSLVSLSFHLLSLFISFEGNHDIRGNQRVSEELFDRVFGNRFRIMSMRGYTFVFVDSNSLYSSHRDIFEELKGDIPPSSPTILFSHMPLYRYSEEVCLQLDANCPLLERFSLSYDHTRTQCDEFRNGTFYHRNIPNVEVVNEHVSSELLDIFQPLLVVSGHLHYFCHHIHIYADSLSLKGGMYTSHEVTIPTLNWRNRVDPSFVILDLDEDGSVSLRKCSLPNEMAVFGIYLIIGSLLICFFFWSCLNSIFSLTKKNR